MVLLSLKKVNALDKTHMEPYPEMDLRKGDRVHSREIFMIPYPIPVSYTHPTLPTNREV